MTPQEIDALPAGRELDALVEEKVFERLVLWLEWYNNPTPHFYNLLDCLPHYSTDIAAVWEVLEHLDAMVWSLTSLPGVSSVKWTATVEQPPLSGRHAAWTAVANTAPLAICRAALKAVGA